MRTITLEEHFASPEFFDRPARFVKERAEKKGGRYAQVMDRLCDLGAKRLGEMDAAVPVGDSRGDDRQGCEHHGRLSASAERSACSTLAIRRI